MLETTVARCPVEGSVAVSRNEYADAQNDTGVGPSSESIVGSRSL